MTIADLVREHPLALVDGRGQYIRTSEFTDRPSRHVQPTGELEFTNESLAALGAPNGLAVGEVYYTNTAGGLNRVPVEESGQRIEPVGVATSATTLTILALGDCSSWAARVELLRIDGETYAFEEDARDNYRSSLHVHDLRRANPDEDRKIVTFAPRLCALYHRIGSHACNEDDVLVLVDEDTGRVLATYGTVVVVRVLPSFIAHWDPDGFELPADWTFGARS